MIAKLVEFREIAPSVRHFVFETPEVGQLAFTPGQFVSFTEMLGGKKVTRPYSIASAPDGNRFAICSSLAENGISLHLFAMKPGDTVEMGAPLGFFSLRNPGREAIFVATGTGIAPFRSMIHAYLGQGHSGKMTLIFGVRHRQSLMYGEEFEGLARSHFNFSFWPTLSRPGAEWTGRTGHVQNHLPEAITDRRDLDVYACGLKQMVDDVRSLLMRMGFDREQIIVEKYD